MRMPLWTHASPVMTTHYHSQCVMNKEKQYSRTRELHIDLFYCLGKKSHVLRLQSFMQTFKMWSQDRSNERQMIPWLIVNTLTVLIYSFTLSVGDVSPLPFPFAGVVLLSRWQSGNNFMARN